MHSKLTHLWAWIVRLTTNWLPDCGPIMAFRGWLYGLAMPRKGSDFQVSSGVRINGLEKLHVGHHVYLAPGVVILADRNITIEDEVMIAHYALITDGNHTARNGSYRYGPRDNSPIVIGRGTWIGAHAVLLPGVRVGCGSVVGAHATVTKDVPDGVVAAGNPARVIRHEAGTERGQPAREPERRTGT